MRSRIRISITVKGRNGSGFLSKWKLRTRASKRKDGYGSGPHLQYVMWVRNTRQNYISTVNTYSTKRITRSIKGLLVQYYYVFILQSSGFLVTVFLLCHREYWVIYRGPGFRAVYDLAPPPPLPPSRQQVVFLSQSSSMSPFELTDRRGAWRRSQIIRRRESLVLYKSFNTLCSTITAESEVRIHPVVFISRLAYI